MEKNPGFCAHGQDCRSLRRDVRWVCLHPMCNNFLELCENCVEAHTNFHLSNKLDHEADFPNPIVSFEVQKETVEKILSKVMNELTVIQEKILSEIRSLSTKESPSETVISELVLIKNQVNELFDDLIEHVKDTSDKITSEKMKTIYEEVNFKIQETHSYTNNLNNMNAMRSVRDVSIYDFHYQTQIQRQRMEQILDECAIKNGLDLVVDEDIALKLLSSVKTNLENILQKPNPRRDEDRLMSSKDGNQSARLKNILFYFEPNSKNFHYLNVGDSSPSFVTIQLAIDFQIAQGSRSILTKNNQIYLVGGYDPKTVSPENEEKFKAVYRLDLEKRQLQKVSTLITLRHSFGLCQLQNSLYIVGGYNYQEGSLAKCERIPIEKEGYSNPIPINNLQKRASHLTVCSWQNKILVKYGGILLDQNTLGFVGKHGDQIMVSDYLTEFYIPANDQWVQIQTLNYLSTFLSNSIEIKNEIIIFGGLSVGGSETMATNGNQHSSSSSELIKISNNIIRMKAHRIMNLDIEISKTPNLQEHSYSYSQPIYKDTSNSRKKRVFFLGFDSTDYKNPALKPVLKSFDVSF